jgi:DNA-binding transcriptional ArsR family regulator
MARSYSDEALDLVAARFKVLSEPTRLRILDVLRSGEKSVGVLVEAVGTSQANVSKHLGILHRHHMVDRRKEGVHSYYRIDDEAIFELCDLVCDAIAAELDDRRRALEASDG